ncbi:hypothetical protein GSI_08487 [Ganoderma sinense ZZ0214-1]|uniref:Uncharacterized protein n=1 Tax=Ganoderma sinense ZZ0214-1 TaxID=1077348 RepID=A0A2G8S3U0_9APHY|nr:hypothetical protein GSI_08487 [Ganoderma sinense ZZ0214-1]
MPSDGRPRRSFLTTTLVLCILHFSGAFANQVIVDDQHPGLVWDGAWEEFTGQPEAEDGTLTWANRTGPTVTLTFTGTSVQVFGAFKPVGTWNIQSLYAIDGGRQTAFVPSPLVPQESFRQKFYDSGPLPLGTHTLKITNLGVQLWIDYFVYDDGGGSGQSTSSLTAASTDRIGGTKSTTPATRPSPSSSSVAGITASSLSSGSGSAESGAIVPSTSSGVITFSQLSTTVSVTGALLTPNAASSLVALTLPQPSSSSISSSLNVTATPGGSQTPRPNPHGLPRAALVGLIVGVSLAAFAVVAVSIWLRRRHIRRTPSEVRVSQYPFVQPAEDDQSAARLGSRESQSSETLFVASLPGSKSLQMVDRRSESSDRGVSLAQAAGPHVVDMDVDAGLISDAASEQSTPPPSYREFEHGAP